MQLSEQSIAHLAIWYIVQYSVPAYQKLVQHFDDVVSAIQPHTRETWQRLNLHANHLKRLDEFHSPTGQQKFLALIHDVKRYTDSIIFQHDEAYPDILKPFADRPAILFVRGDASCLSQPQIAMVGSRDISPHGKQTAYDFAQYFTQHHFVVTSGLALGIDAAAHLGALQSGRTIAVIGTGLDQCYPSEHINLWQKIIAHSGCIVSEFFPHTKPNRHNFPRRNRLISGLSLGTVVVEAGEKSGSLITAQYAAEQGKHIFAIPGHIYSEHHKGCHQLIREGAILIDHPSQVIEDVMMFNPLSQNHSRQQPTSTPTLNTQPLSPPATPLDSTPPTPEIPEHLQPIWQHLDWSIAISLDELAQHVQLEISQLNVAMVELELLGLCTQHAGRYIRTHN